MNETMVCPVELFNMQIREAIIIYGDNQIDILVQDNEVYGSYHSTNNSFSVTDTFSLDQLGGTTELKKYEIEFQELCVCVD